MATRRSRSSLSPISGWPSRPTGRSRCARSKASTCASIAGEFIGLVGESGAGKTTLARAIMGLVPPPGVIERGQVLFDGRDLSLLDDRRAPRSAGPRACHGDRQSARRTQSGHAGRPADRNIAYYHLGVGRAESDRLALEMLRAVRIPDPERRFGAYPHELSGGMAQRVAIAMALICSPRLVISDDATSGLDVTVQAQVLELLQRLVGGEGRGGAVHHARHCHYRAFLLAHRHHLCRRNRRTRRNDAFFAASGAPLQHHAARRLLAQSGIARALDPCSRRGRNGSRGRLRLRAAVRAPAEALP